MAPSPNTPMESGSLIGNADTGARKRRKVEQAGQEDDNSAHVAVDGLSKEDRKLAKKARRAASRAEIGANKSGSENVSRVSAPNNEEGPLKPEKAERRRKKRKLEEEGESAADPDIDGPGITDSNTKDQSLDVALSQDAVLRDGNNKEAEAKIEQNGAEAKSIEKAAAKASRKPEKGGKKQKAQKKETNGVASKAKDEDALPDSVQVQEREATVIESKGLMDGIEGADTKENRAASAKAARKAEKEEMKRLKKAQGSGSFYSEDPALTSLSQTEIDSFLSDKFISITDPSSKTLLRPIIDFAYLPLATRSHSLFADFKAPTPIQAAAWPFLLSNRDVIGVAETGSGKTLAFGVPCIRSIILSVLVKPKPKALPIGSAETKAVIVSPTRELAIQIHEQIAKLASPALLSTACIYGGVPKDAQRAIIKTAHIIVATPGRLNDFLDEGAADLSRATYLVLDEADRMLDKGFENDIRKIISCCPPTAKGRQTLMFTATWPPSVREIAATFMNQPVHITIGDDNPSGELRANKSITQKVEVVEPEAKQARLLQIIKEHQGTSKTKNDRILIFCLYKKEATRVEGYLHSKGLKVAGIHGDMNQHKRMESLEAFKSGACPLLVATDVAARGLDIPAVKLVLNVTFPLTVEDYVHRIGRTGRAGAAGLSITLFTIHDKAQSGALINVLRAAGQEIPEDLLKFGTTVKKKAHETYGAFVKDMGDGPKTGTKIKFD